MNKGVTILLYLSSLVLLYSCKQKQAKTLFTAMEHTGISFSNTLQETREFNVFNYRNFYNGGGAAIGDLNNDSLPDVFFTGNQVPNKLFLNKGNFQFEDISAKAGFGEKKQWSTGVVFADINADGWLDIYICNAGNMFDTTLRRNQLFINNHDLTFTEKAVEYGLANNGYTTQASFFDYDLDGDLDCFMVNNSPIPVNTLNYANKRELPADQWEVAPFLKGGGDHLYRNDNGHYMEVTKEAGIHGSLISLGLGVTVSDVNGDHYPDVYVSNDFFEIDYLYINQRNGTFKDELSNWIQHTSLASMGADVQDINNDGYPDLFTTDMLPADDYRLKTSTSFENYDVYGLKERSGFYYQYMQNALQLNNRNGKFSEIARFSGVQASDWSWGALMFDADNDGYNDLYVCNGIAHDLTDQDFIDFFANDIVQKMKTSQKKEEIDSIIAKMPSVPLRNGMFKNNGNLHFSDIGKEWGFTTPSFSNGAAYGDLDNDGDLDLVVNNVNMPCFVYRNNSREQNQHHYLAVQLNGKGANRFAIGSMIRVFAGPEILTREVIPSRGFESCVDYKQIIGLGTRTVDSIVITWPDRTITTLLQPATDRVIAVSQEGAPVLAEIKHDPLPRLFEPADSFFQKHTEDDFVDFYQDRNIPVMLSKEGPKAAVADVNSDGWDDVYVGGAKGQPGALYLQTASGFTQKKVPAFEADKEFEDVAVLFFDCDKDGDLDLFAGAGGNNLTPRHSLLQHRLYRNDGKGGFTKDTTAFPVNSSNISIAVTADYDQDGDPDLFVGGRSQSFNYGAPAQSCLFRNDGAGHFTDVSPQVLPALSRAGMITGAVWADVNGDKSDELILCGEWMTPQVYTYTQGHFTKLETGLDQYYGWWQTVAAGDLDNDGDKDLVLGNFGENFYLHPDENKPVKLWVNDFDQNGIPDKVFSYTVEGKDMPVFLKKEFTENLPYLKKENLTHHAFAQKSIPVLFGEELSKASVVQTWNYTSSVVALNDGKGRFTLKRLPTAAQLSSINCVLIKDVNKDGIPDLLTAGNFTECLPQFGRLDANYGQVLIGKGNGEFGEMPPARTGLVVTGMVRDLKVLAGKEKEFLVFFRNNERPAVYRFAENKKKITP